MLGNVNWCCISTTKMLLLHDAVYYREQRFATESAVVVVGQVFSILVQCLTSTSLEQFLILEILEQYLVSGTLEQYWLTSEVNR